MKKSLMLFIAAGLVAIMTGCGGGSSSASSHATPAATDAQPASEVAFDVAPTESATNATYLTTAQGAFPPAPPSSELATVQEEANNNL